MNFNVHYVVESKTVWMKKLECVVRILVSFARHIVFEPNEFSPESLSLLKMHIISSLSHSLGRFGFRLMAKNGYIIGVLIVQCVQRLSVKMTH
jgi:hypothetical protein